MFGICESELDTLYWEYSFDELKKRIELQVGYTTASHLSQFSALAAVASAMFGGGDKKSEPTEDLTQLSPDAFIARVSQIGAG